MTVMRAPLDRWLILLTQGWRLPWIVEPMIGHHGVYSILVEVDEVDA